MENSAPDVLSRRGGNRAARDVARVDQDPDSEGDAGHLPSLFENITATLMKKGLLREDPYAYEGAVTAIAVPPDSALPDSDNTAALSRRIAAYRRQVDFLLDASQFTLASLDLPVPEADLVSFLLHRLGKLRGGFSQPDHARAVPVC